MYLWKHQFTQSAETDKLKFPAPFHIIRNRPGNYNLVYVILFYFLFSCSKTSALFIAGSYGFGFPLPVSIKFFRLLPI